jgi:hypothetical protein
MKLWFKGFLIACIIFVLSLAIFHALVNLKGKDLLVKKLEEALKRKVTVGSLCTTFPTNIYVRDLEIQDLIKIDEVTVTGEFFDIVHRCFGVAFLKLDHPVVTIAKNPGQSAPEAIVSLVPAGPSPQKKFVLSPFYIAAFVIHKGSLTFIDNISGTQQMSFKANDIEMKVDNINFGFGGSRITSFELKGLIPWPDASASGKLELTGWINVFKKDMQAKLNIEDIDAVYLAPYYSQWLDLEKARIEKARLKFTSDINGLNNEVIAQCHMELTDISFKQRAPEEEESRAEKIAATVLGIFKALDQDKVALNFTVKTSMDRPEFGFEYIKAAITDKVSAAKGKGINTEDVVLFPAKLVEGTVKGTTEVTTAVIGGFFSLGKELGKAFFGAFSREGKQAE